MCRRFPDAFARVARGELHLSALCELAPHLKAENASELFEACRGKTRRQVEEEIAARFPRPDVREQIRRLPERTAIASEAPRRRELESLSVGRFGVHFTADAELRELLERARELSSHRLRRGDLSSLMKLVLATFVKREEARRFALGKRPQKANVSAKAGAAAKDHASSAPPGGARALAVRESKRRGRYIPAAERREVYRRDQGRCSFVAESGQRCEARILLELDHVKPWAKQGASLASNLRLRCRAHNQLHARHCLGALHLAAKLTRHRALSAAARAGGTDSDIAATRAK